MSNGETWRHTGVTWPGGHHGGLFQMLTCEHGGDGYVYVCSTGFRRDKGLMLQRVPADRLTDPAAWQACSRGGFERVIHGPLNRDESRVAAKSESSNRATNRPPERTRK